MTDIIINWESISSELTAKLTTLTGEVQKLKKTEAKQSKTLNTSAANLAALRSDHVKQLELLKQLKAHKAAESTRATSGPSLTKLQDYCQTALRYYVAKFGIAWIDIKTRQIKVMRGVDPLPKKLNKFKKFPFS